MGARCNARASEGCNPVATIPTGDSLAGAIDEGTDTVYVVSGNDVWVIDGSQCNGTVTTGCHKHVGTIKTPGNVEALSLDLQTATLYMASLNGAIYVADVAKCTKMTTRGCSAPTKTINDPYIPEALSVDTRTDTIYAANNGYCPGTTESTDLPVRDRGHRFGDRRGCLQCFGERRLPAETSAHICRRGRRLDGTRREHWYSLRGQHRFRDSIGHRCCSVQQSPHVRLPSRRRDQHGGRCVLFGGGQSATYIVHAELGARHLDRNERRYL